MVKSDSEGSMSEHDVNVEVTDAGAEDYYPMQCGKVRKGEYILIRNHPCKIIELTTSKTGKHGHAKANITAIDIFDGSRYEISEPTSHNVYVPYVTKKEYQLCDINDDYLSLINTENLNEKRDDFKLPQDKMGEIIKETYDKGDSDIVIIIMASMKREMIMNWKTI